MILIDNIEARAKAALVVARGGIIAFRTDTFYGLGVNPFDARAVRRLQALKGREANKPILIVISNRQQAARFVRYESSTFNLLSERYWPGPLTIVSTADENVPHELTAGTGTIGVRLPDDGEVQALIERCGGALTATSANVAGSPPSRSAAEVARYFPQKNDKDGTAKLDMILDGGTVRSDKPSTVVDVSLASESKIATLIREGAVSFDVLTQTLHSIGVTLKKG